MITCNRAIGSLENRRRATAGFLGLAMMAVAVESMNACATVKLAQPAIAGLNCPAGTSPRSEQKGVADSFVRVVSDPSCPGSCFWLPKSVGKIQVEVRAKAVGESYLWCDPLPETIARRCPNLNPARQKVCSDDGNVTCVDLETSCATRDKGKQDATLLQPTTPARKPRKAAKPEPPPTPVVAPPSQKGAPPKCVKFTLLQSLVAPPSKIALSFRLTDCDGRPISGALFDDFQIAEDDAVLSVSEGRRSLDTTAASFPRSTLLLLDLSGSIWNTGSLPTLQTAVKGFVKKATSPGHFIAIFAFDGSSELSKVVDFTDDPLALQAGVDALAKFASRDQATNLNGALLKALDVLELRRDGPFAARAASFSGALAVFTDGKDTAQRVKQEEALLRIRGTPFAVFAIGLGPEVNPVFIKDVGKNRSFLVERESHEVPELVAAFRKMAEDITVQASGRYRLTYCSPKRAGIHGVEISVSGAKGTLSYPFNASRFEGGCDPTTGEDAPNGIRVEWVEVPVGKDTTGKTKSISVMTKRVTKAQMEFLKTGEFATDGSSEFESDEIACGLVCAASGGRTVTPAEFGAIAKAGRKTEGVGNCEWPNALGIFDLGAGWNGEWAAGETLFVKQGSACHERLVQSSTRDYHQYATTIKPFRCTRE
ncbi:MAG: VWA domain-containing protein [Deltaproteobacteria bacterium]|nr:VWA domain-containing protein [Deltaproteobacteria bacterium]